jgi:hypothetical protein
VTSKPVHQATKVTSWKAADAAARAGIEDGAIRAAMVEVLAEAKAVEPPLKIATFEC